MRPPIALKPLVLLYPLPMYTRFVPCMLRVRQGVVRVGRRGWSSALVDEGRLGIGTVPWLRGACSLGPRWVLSGPLWGSLTARVCWSGLGWDGA